MLLAQNILHKIGGEGWSFPLRSHVAAIFWGKASEWRGILQLLQIFYCHIRPHAMCHVLNIVRINQSPLKLSFENSLSLITGAIIRQPGESSSS